MPESLKGLSKEPRSLLQLRDVLDVIEHPRLEPVFSCEKTGSESNAGVLTLALDSDPIF
jgi:hypothetical protein